MNKAPITPHSLEIIQIIARAPAALTTGALLTSGEYIKNQLAEGGGFVNRAGHPDLYYTLFGLSCVYVLQLDLPLNNTLAWLQCFDPHRLTLVELSSLTKCLAVFAMLHDPQALKTMSQEIVPAVTRFRTNTGGFSYDGSGAGFPYAAFLAINIYQDLGKVLSEPETLATALHGYQKDDGRFANPDSLSSGLLLSTVAGMLTLRQLTGSISQSALSWVKGQFSPAGGFKADPGSELPDMLSTAVALFALNVGDVNMTPYRASARRFVEEHWLANGSFSATLRDETGDCEYSYYGLLALGALV